MLIWNCSLYQCPDHVSASYSNLSQVARSSEKRKRSRKKENSSVYSVCFSWFAIVQAIGQVLYICLHIDDFSTQWVLTSVTLLTLGSVFTNYFGEQISDLKLGNSTSLLIFTSMISYLPASFGRTAAQAFQDRNYVGLGTIIFSFFLLVLGIVYVQEAERRIPLNYASRIKIHRQKWWPSKICLSTL